MHELSAVYHTLQQRILHACQTSNRAPDSVRLLAVSKNRDAMLLRQLADLGQQDFAENYLQEALLKIRSLADLPLQWHFIGPLQSNKTRAIASHFHWVHSLDRLKIARRLSEHRPAHMPPLNVCLQVNVDQEPGKQGIPPDGIMPLAMEILSLPQLQLRGLMCIPLANSPDHNRQAFKQLATALSQLRHNISDPDTLASLDTLSMGMSDDFDVAIAEGATLVRVGTALFGPRPLKE